MANQLISSARNLHREGKDLSAAEKLVMAIGLAQDMARHGDYSHLKDLFHMESRSATVAWEILSAHSLSAAELQTWATWMDRLASARPGLERIIEVDSALSQKDVLTEFKNVAIYTASPFPALTVTWR